MSIRKQTISFTHLFILFIFFIHSFIIIIFIFHKVNTWQTHAKLLKDRTILKRVREIDEGGDGSCHLFF